MKEMPSITRESASIGVSNSMKLTDLRFVCRSSNRFFSSFFVLQKFWNPFKWNERERTERSNECSVCVRFFLGFGNYKRKVQPPVDFDENGTVQIRDKEEWRSGVKKALNSAVWVTATKNLTKKTLRCSMFPNPSHAMPDSTIKWERDGFAEMCNELRIIILFKHISLLTNQHKAV